MAKATPISEGLDLRIARAVKLAGGAKAAAAKTGFGVSTIYNYARLEPPPTIMFMYALCSAAGVRPEWLFMGEPPEVEGGESGDWETGRADEAHAVPVLELEVSAGEGIKALAEGISDEFWFYSPGWLTRNLGPSQGLRVVRVRGDSQEPEVRDGDWLVIDIDRREITNSMSVIRLDDMLLLKRLQLEGRYLQLNSANPLYKSTVLDMSKPDDRERVEVIAEARMVVRTFGARKR